jgi:hypothetical protein
MVLSNQIVETDAQVLIEAANASHVDFGIPEAQTIKKISSLAEYMSLMSGMTKSENRFWFRGTRKSIYDLEPSLFRHPSIKDANKLIELEWGLLADFRHKAPPFTTSLPRDDLGLLFLMQHFGVPTRLLDWSESPFVALFFALENARQDEAHDASVWILNPVNLNSLAANLREGSNQIYGAYAPELANYKPRADGNKLIEKLPSALFGIHNSPRIVAQRGTFVIFGKDIIPMNRHDMLKDREDIVKRIDIDKEAKRQMFFELTNMGVSDSVIYPDLDGLGREIKNYRGF